MSHTYLSLPGFKGEGVANISRAGNDAALLSILEAASRYIEAWTGRRFYPVIETRYFSGNDKNCLELPGWDLIAVTTLAEDDDRDASFGETWASTDYYLTPYEHDPTSHVRPRPYWGLEVNRLSNGTKTYFPAGQRRFSLTGTYGYCNLTVATGATISEGAEFGASDTTLTVSDGSAIKVGETLVIDSEHLYVTGEPVEGGNDKTVSRGANGTTAAAHDDGTAISRLEYPLPIVEATKILASQMWRGRSSGYTDRQGFAETGYSTMEPDSRRRFMELLDEYKLMRVG